jgi:hypothetical protein
LRARRIPTRRRPSKLGLLLLLALAGCGGGGDDAAPPPGPAIERATADQLASTSDAIADALDNGDVCSAAGLADQLNDQVIEAINARRIPPAFQEDLQARANELVNTVNCAPSTVEDEDDDEENKPKNDKKKEMKEEKEEQQEDSDEELVPTEPLPTITEGEE